MDKKVEEAYVELLMQVTGLPKHDILPLRESDVDSINSMLESLGEVLGRPHAEILKLRFGLDGQGIRSLFKIGEDCGVVSETIRLQQDKALTKLCDCSRAAFFEKFSRPGLEETIKRQELEILRLREELEQKVQALLRVREALDSVSIQSNLNCLQNLKVGVRELDLSTRSRNCLHMAGIRTLKDLVEKTERELLILKNLGHRSVAEIRKALARRGLCLSA